MHTFLNAYILMHMNIHEFMLACNTFHEHNFLLLIVRTYVHTCVYSHAQTIIFTSCPARVATMASSVFSHSSFAHFAFNMITFQSFGVAVMYQFPGSEFLPFYLSAGYHHDCYQLFHVLLYHCIWMTFYVVYIKIWKSDILHYLLLFVTLIQLISIS